MSSAARCTVVVGPGGVGKTTMAAALATAAAASGRRTVVVTIDPARRLAQSLGLEGTAGNEIVEAGEGLWATMLDAEAGWDELVRRHSRDAATAERIISNALYRNVTGRFVHSLNYLAMERLGQLVDDPRFDLVVVDTPPSHNALDFLDSPERMEEFFSGRLLRWITAPARNKVVSLTSRPFLAVADRVLGARFVSDIVEFFTLLAGVEPGLRRRAAGIADLLRSPETRFALVTTPETGPAAETRSLSEALAGRGMAPWMCFVNRCATAPTCRDPDPAGALVGLLAAAGERDPARVAAPLVRVVEADRSTAVRHGAAVDSLGKVMPVVTLGELGNADPVGVVNGLAAELAGVPAADVPSGGGVLRDGT